MKPIEIFCGFLFLLLAATPNVILLIQASESLDLEFDVFEWGVESGYTEETYLVARTQSEWEAIWERHSAPYMPSTPSPDVLFSEKMVICGFMGTRPTAGYSISINRMWVDENRVHVELVKHNPGNQSVVAQVLTHPYVFASLNQMDIPVIFDLHVETDTNEEPVIPELSFSEFTLVTFLVFSILMFTLIQKMRASTDIHTQASSIVSIHVH